MTESCSACFTKTGKPKKLRYTYAGEARHHALIASLRAELSKSDQALINANLENEQILKETRAENNKLREKLSALQPWSKP
jgi:hypothetical protein